MTQKEFEERTNISLTAGEFEAVHDIYMACGDDVDKDEFCALWKGKEYRELLNMAANEKKVTEMAYGMAMNKIKKIEEQQRKQNVELAEFLIGKACAYDDTDFYREAVKLIGQRDVVLMKMRMDLPLWDEDKDYIKGLLKDNTQGRKIAG